MANYSRAIERHTSEETQAQPSAQIRKHQRVSKLCHPKMLFYVWRAHNPNGLLTTLGRYILCVLVRETIKTEELLTLRWHHKLGTTERFFLLIYRGHHGSCTLYIQDSSLVHCLLQIRHTSSSSTKIPKLYSTYDRLIVAAPIIAVLKTKEDICKTKITFRLHRCTEHLMLINHDNLKD